MIRRRPGGFTLLEVLLATALLAAGLALAFATLRSATAVAGRGETMARESERIRAVEGYLRTRLAGAVPATLATDPASGMPLRFIGEPQRMRFAAELPGYLDDGGLRLHDLTVASTGAALELRLGFAMVQDGQVLEDTRISERLAGGLRRVAFRYRGLDRTGALGPWQDRWEASDLLPLQVAVHVESAGGASWPTLVATLMRSDGGGTAGRGF